MPRSRISCRFFGICATAVIAGVINPALAASRSMPCATDGQTGFNPDHPYSCTITITESPDGTEENIRIDQPYVSGPFFEYKSILFHPSDSITITADGCVQTAGKGDTWKKYVNPSGDQSGPTVPDGLYYGTIKIKGATANGNLLEGTPLYSLTTPSAPVVPIFIQPIETFPGDSPIDLILGYV